MEPIIVVKNLTKIYPLYESPKDRLIESLRLSRRKLHKDFFALDGVTFEIHPGETVGIIGRNGAGKSTLLKIITGVLNPTSGSVMVTGRVSALLELGAGFNQEYTGLENVFLNGMIMGFSRDEMKQRLNDILEFADIGDFIHQPIKTYSSGMFMRLAFSVAINVDPEILIIDEALSVGDILFQAKCFRKFQEMKDSGKTILFVTHSLNNIVQYCERCIVLDDGHKIDEGDPTPMVDLFKRILASPHGEGALVADLAARYRHDPQTSVEIQSWKKRLVLNKDIQDYGSHDLEIVDFGILDSYGQVSNIIDAGAPFQIVMRVLAHKTKFDPIFAFSIRNVQGVEVTGTNTMYNDIATGRLEAGESIEVVFTQQLSLVSDGYLLSLGCTGYNGEDFEVHHRLYDVTPIQVLNGKRMVGFFDPDSHITIRRN